MARRRMQKLQRMSAAQRQQQQVPAYRDLIAATADVVQKARHVVKVAKTKPVDDLTERLTAEEFKTQITHYCKLADRVIDQARRRVLYGEDVPCDQKIYSIFEPHTGLIKRGKAQTPVEFGHKVFLAESANGFITQYRVLDGNPSDEAQLEPALQRHHDVFHRAPETAAFDRAFHSPRNQDLCRKAGIGCISIPQCGGQKTPQRQALESSPEFKLAQRFRAGIEGTISVLFRGRGMKRCLARGQDRFQMLVGAAVIATNLLRFARLLLEQKTKNTKRRAA
jgi:IS5 family transposase